MATRLPHCLISLCSCLTRTHLQIFHREHFFRGRDNDDQLVRILKVLGTDAFERYLEKYGLFVRSDNPGILETCVPSLWITSPWRVY